MTRNKKKLLKFLLILCTILFVIISTILIVREVARIEKQETGMEVMLPTCTVDQPIDCEEMAEKLKIEYEEVHKKGKEEIKKMTMKMEFELGQISRKANAYRAINAINEVPSTTGSIETTTGINAIISTSEDEKLN